MISRLEELEKRAPIREAGTQVSYGHHEVYREDEGAPPSPPRYPITEVSQTTAGDPAVAAAVLAAATGVGIEDETEPLGDQADLPLTPGRFLAVSGALGGFAALLCAVGKVPFFLIPIFVLTATCLPFVWLVLRRRKRLRNFGKQLPEYSEIFRRRCPLYSSQQSVAFSAFFMKI